ncbi:hypothetical protein OSC52_10365 [Clostridium pasteurianum]|nr:hypothetical protein [Clostridium pasteurianum]UZW16195.1 hypothetical protein OSC52_10365 [Clostridium pasteurianum]
MREYYKEHFYKAQCSNLEEGHIIFGTEKKLREAILVYIEVL